MPGPGWAQARYRLRPDRHWECRFGDDRADGGGCATSRRLAKAGAGDGSAARGGCRSVHGWAAAGCQRSVHDRDGYQDALCGARVTVSGYRDRFHIPETADGSDCVYLCGHSLGLQPKSVRSYIEQELKDWELLGVDGHFRARHPWVQYNKLLTEQTARLVGAKPLEVVTMNSLAVNLHLMMVSFYRPTARRHRIVVEENAFPSDQYAVKSQIRFHGFDPA